MEIMKLSLQFFLVSAQSIVVCQNLAKPLLKKEFWIGALGLWGCMARPMSCGAAVRGVVAAELHLENY